MSDVIVVIGAGSIGQAIGRSVSASWRYRYGPSITSTGKAIRRHGSNRPVSEVSPAPVGLRIQARTLGIQVQCPHQVRAPRARPAIHRRGEVAQ